MHYSSYMYMYKTTVLLLLNMCRVEELCDFNVVLIVIFMLTYGCNRVGISGLSRTQTQIYVTWGNLITYIWIWVRDYQWVSFLNFKLGVAMWDVVLITVQSM